MASILGTVKLLKGQDLEALLVDLLAALLAAPLVGLADLVDHTRDPMAQVDRGRTTLRCIRSLSMWVCPSSFVIKTLSIKRALT